MKDLIINDITTLCLPDKDGEVEIEINGYDCSHFIYVPFGKLEKWVASIREQIIKSSNEQTKVKKCPTCDDCHGKGEVYWGCDSPPPIG